MFISSGVGSRRGEEVRMQKRTEKNRAEKLDEDVGDECTAHRRVVIRKEMREHVW